MLRGPVVIDPVFSSAWARPITFLTPLSEQNIRDMGAKKGLENSLVWFGEVALDLPLHTHIVTSLFIFFLEITLFFFCKRISFYLLTVVFVFRIILSHLTEHNV